MTGTFSIAELTRVELRDLAPRATLILPTAAIEQHGPHLPLVTDTLIAERLAVAVAEATKNSVTTCVSPVVAFGSSHHHLAFGAMSLRSLTFHAVLTDLFDSACRSGFRRIFVLNAHGGNDEIVRLVARDVAQQHDVSIAANSYWTLARESVRPLWGGEPLPGHAGLFETSLMLALAPHLVHQEFLPHDKDHPVPLSYQGVIKGSIARHGEWERIDGYSDASTEASSGLGQRLFQQIVAALASALTSFHDSTEFGEGRTQETNR